MKMRTGNKRTIELDHCIIGITNDNELQFDITRFYEDTDPKVEYHKYVLKFNNREELVQAVSSSVNYAQKQTQLRLLSSLNRCMIPFMLFNTYLVEILQQKL